MLRVTITRVATSLFLFLTVLLFTYPIYFVSKVVPNIGAGIRKYGNPIQAVLQDSNSHETSEPHLFSVSEPPGEPSRQVEGLQKIHTLKLVRPLPDVSFKPDFSKETVCSVQHATSAAEIRCKDRSQFKCSKVSSLDYNACPLTAHKPGRNFNCSSTRDFLKLMTERKEILKEGCKKIDKSGEKFKYHRIKEQFHFNKVGDKGLTWCPVFKAGSSNINSFFCPLYYPSNRCQDNYYNGAKLWRYSEFFVPERTEIPKFLVTRDPFDRVLSAYRDKIENGRSSSFLDNMFHRMIAPHRLISPASVPHKKDLVLTARDKADRKIKGHYKFPEDFDPDNPYESPMYATFTEFVMSLLTGNSNEHWSRITDFCAACSPGAEFKYILKVHDFDCEFNNMLTAINSPELQDIHEKDWETNMNHSRQKYNDLYEYYGALSEELLAAFHEFYKDDCILFGYDCEKIICEIKTWKRQNRAPIEL